VEPTDKTYSFDFSNNIISSIHNNQIICIKLYGLSIFSSSMLIFKNLLGTE